METRKIAVLNMPLLSGTNINAYEVCKKQHKFLENLLNIMSGRKDEIILSNCGSEIEGPESVINLLIRDALAFPVEAQEIPF